MTQLYVTDGVTSSHDLDFSPFGFRTQNFTVSSLFMTIWTFDSRCTNIKYQIPYSWENLYVFSTERHRVQLSKYNLLHCLSINLAKMYKKSNVRSFFTRKFSFLWSPWKTNRHLRFHRSTRSIFFARFYQQLKMSHMVLHGLTCVSGCKWWPEAKTRDQINCWLGYAPNSSLQH